MGRERGRSCGEGSAGPIDISLGKGGKRGNRERHRGRQNAENAEIEQQQQKREKIGEEKICRIAVGKEKRRERQRRRRGCFHPKASIERKYKTDERKVK